MKIIVLAGMIFSLSTLLKVCSVIVLCSLHIHSHEHEHDHRDMILGHKQIAQTSGQPLE